MPTKDVRPSGRTALDWLDEDRLVAPAAPAALDSAPHAYRIVAPDLLARRPRRSPLRPGVVVPVLSVLGLAAAYAATTLLWPLTAVAPTIQAVPVDDVVSPASSISWPEDGEAAVGVSGFDTVPASATEAVPMASITKLVTSLMILDEMPLAPGEGGPSFAFTYRDRATYYDYLAADESALDVPVGGSLTEYQMLQGILIGSAGNYADRLVSTIWPDDTGFAAAAKTWLAAHGLTGITIVEPTGIRSANTADPASLITLARVSLADPVVAEIVRTKSVDLPGAGTVRNTNDLLSDAAVLGLKTGTLSGAYNLLAAKQITVGDTDLRVYASVLGETTDALRDGETARLLADVAAEVALPTSLPADTLVGVVETAWGASSDVVTDADAPLVLWNGASGEVTAELAIGDARSAGQDVGTVTVTGPVNTTSARAHLTDDLPDPDAWWRLTHPLELFGLAS